MDSRTSTDIRTDEVTFMATPAFNDVSASDMSDAASTSEVRFHSPLRSHLSRRMHTNSVTGNSNSFAGQRRASEDLTQSENGFLENNDAISYGPHNTTLKHVDVAEIGSTRKEFHYNVNLASPHENNFVQYLNRQCYHGQQLTSTPLYTASVDNTERRRLSAEFACMSLRQPLVFDDVGYRNHDAATNRMPPPSTIMEEAESDGCSGRNPKSCTPANSTRDSKLSAVGASDTFSSVESDNNSTDTERCDRELQVLKTDNADLRASLTCKTVAVRHDPERIARQTHRHWQLKLKSQAESLSLQHDAELKKLNEKHSHEMRKTKDELNQLRAESAKYQTEHLNVARECDAFKREASSTTNQQPVAHRPSDSISAVNTIPTVPKLLYDADIQKLEKKLRATEDVRYELAKKITELESELGRAGKVTIDRLQCALRHQKLELSDVWRRFEQAQQQISTLHNNHLESDELHKKQVEDLLNEKNGAVMQARESCLRLHEDALVQLRIDFRQRLDHERHTIEQSMQETIDKLSSQLNWEHAERFKSRTLNFESSLKIETLERQLEQVKIADNIQRSVSVNTNVTDTCSRNNQTETDVTGSFDELQSKLRETTSDMHTLINCMHKLKAENERLKRVIEKQKTKSDRDAKPNHDADEHLPAERANLLQLEKQYNELEMQHTVRKLAQAAVGSVPKLELEKLHEEFMFVKHDYAEAMSKLARQRVDEVTLEKFRQHIVWLEKERDKLKWDKRRLKHFITACLDRCETCARRCNFSRPGTAASVAGSVAASMENVSSVEIGDVAL